MPIPDRLRRKYAELCSLPHDADARLKRARGYAFETLLADLLRADHLDPRSSYKPAGEQIDGSFFLHGTVFLLEAKWHREAIPASTLYQFKGKVDGKLAGTLGVFISMSGYSDDAVDALVLGKSLNVVLFDKPDIDAAIDRQLGFLEVLRRKLRKAAEEGVVYFPTEAELVTRAASIQVENEATVSSRTSPAARTADLVIVCESDLDRELLAQIVKRTLAETASARAIRIVTARGKVSIPRVANAVHASVEPDAKVLIVVDSDADSQGTLEMLKQNVAFTDWAAAIPEPDIEAWIGLDSGELRTLGGRKRLAKSLDALGKVDLKALADRDQAFARLYRAVIGS